MEDPLGGLEGGVGAVELLELRPLVGEGLGRADAGEAGLNVGVDDGGFLLHGGGGLAHGAAAGPDHGEEHRDDAGNHQGQPPLDGEHDGQGPRDGDAGDEDVLRAVVGQLRDVEEVRRQAAHELPGAVFVVVVEAQLLHVAEEVVADVRLHQDAEGVAPVADDIGQQGPEDKGGKHHRHHAEEGLVGASRQQLIHAPPGHGGKGQVDHGNQQGAAEVHDEQLPVGPEVGEKNLQGGFSLEILGGHKRILHCLNIILQSVIIA